MILTALFRNIKKNKSIFLLLFLSLFISSVVFLFSIGLTYHFNAKLDDGDIDGNFIGFTIIGQTTKADMSALTESLPENITNKLSWITCNSFTTLTNIGDCSMVFYFIYKNDEYYFSQNIADSWENDAVIESGRMFTKDEYSQGKNVAIILGEADLYQWVPTPGNVDSITAFGQEYEVIGTLDADTLKHIFYSAYVPFTSLPDDTELTGDIFFVFEEKLTQSFYDEANSFISQNLGDKAMPMNAKIDLRSNSRYYISMIFVGVLIAILAALNVCMIYSYIVTSRTKQFSIFRMCGATLSNVRKMILTELLFTAAPVSIISAIIYHFVLLPWFSEHFALLSRAYSIPVYAAAIAIFIGIAELSLCLSLKKMSGQLNILNSMENREL